MSLFLAGCIVLNFGSTNACFGQAIGSDSTSFVQKTHIRTLDATQIRSNNATLNAKIISLSNDILSYQFEYQTDSNHTQTIEVTKKEGSDKLVATVAKLTAETDYSYRVVAQTNFGKIEGEWMKFKTLPPILTLNAPVTHHVTSLKNFASNALNLNTLTGKKYKLVKACDYKSATVRNRAVAIAAMDAGNFNLAQICDIFDYCYNNWHYVNDPSSGDLYQSASSSLSNGLSGDCDDFAILVCSMLMSIGGDARITAAYNGSNGHAYTEISLGKADMKKVANYIAARYSAVWTGKVNYHIDKYGNCWLNMDWWAKHPGGKYYEAKRGTRFFILDNYCEDF